MKVNKTLTALIASAGLGLSGHAFAAGTDANTDITNTVSLDYKVSGVDQNDVTSNATFKVDHKVDMNLTSDTASADTVPGESVDLEYSITNTGNKDLAYSLSITNNGDVNHTPISVAFYSDAARTTILTNNKVAVAEDATVKVYATVEVTKNVNIKNGDTVEMLVSARALKPTDTDGTDFLTQDLTAVKNDNLTTEYVVFAEDATINSNKQDGTITVQTDRDIVTAHFTDPADGNAAPKLNVAIINDVICDADFTKANTEDYTVAPNLGNCPDVLAANKASYLPKAIPNSMAKFTYTAKNTGAVAANDVTFIETLPAEYADNSLANPTLQVGPTGALVSQTLNAVTGTPSAANEYKIDGNTITIFVGDIAADREFEVTYSGIVE